MGGRSFREIPVIPFDVPDPGFLPVAHVLFPEQVVAGMTVIRDGHVERTLWVFAILHRHLDIDRTQVRVGDRRAGVDPGFFHVPAMILLSLVPNHMGHIRTQVGGCLAVVGKAEDHSIHLASEPFYEGLKSNSCHLGILVS